MLGPMDAGGPEERRTTQERLLGGALRGLAVAVAVLPACALAGRSGRFALGASAAAGVVAATYFVLERRDRGLPGAAWRLAVAMLVALIAVPAANEWARFHDPVRPGAGVDAVTDWLGDRIDWLLDDPWRFARVFPALLAGVLLGGWAYVRTRTAAAWPQVIAGFITLSACFTVRDDGVAAALFGALAPALVVRAERTLVARVDPRAPVPVERDPRPLLAAWTLVLLLALSLHTRDRNRSLSPPGAWSSSANGAIPALNAVLRAQRLGGDGVHASTAELPSFVAAGVRGGVFQGYVLRLVRSAVSPTTFGAAADPTGPAGTNRFLVLRPDGGLSVWPRPALLDPVTCEPMDK